MDQKQRIIQIQDITDKISPSFCLAKWHHTTIYLQSGETHSCYHPAPHTIPLHEIAVNPSALHNTSQKKSERLEMLVGGKPTGCQYCWNIEALGDEYISDRKERNASIYTPARLAEVEAEGPNFNVNPEYIEISFGNECNFKCGYCHPKASSAYYKEIKDFGPYPVKNHGFGIEGLTIYEEETNPYVKAWWQWWPSVSKTLNILRITGGEPLLQKSTWRLFDELEKNPRPNLELNINSNLGVKPVLIDRLAEKIRKLKENKCIKSFQLFTSVDTWGPQAEYIRTGLDLSIWERNLERIVTETNSPVSLMITFNILSVPNFKQLLIKILEWREKYDQYKEPGQDRFRNIRFDVPYLKEPLQYDINLLPKNEFMPYMYDVLKFTEQNMEDLDKSKFSVLELEKIKRLVKYMETTQYADDRIEEGRKDFHAWFTEYDRRRGTDFLSTFPELANFYRNCNAIS